MQTEKSEVRLSSADFLVQINVLICTKAAKIVATKRVLQAQSIRKMRFLRPQLQVLATLEMLG